ncbi:MAG: Tab2/Atab2 family RNA-binding protein [Cyanobacteriota bacterium]|nr:Tab2/Atab2 family RNA-binding protein [Cyanobacteriota bacterium]
MSALHAPDWELDYYSRPVVESDGKKRWELLICSTPDAAGTTPPFQWVQTCPAASVNSIWLRDALQQAIDQAEARGLGRPRRLRCWRGAMRTMVQRAADGLGLELVPSRRCYALVTWLQERERSVYPAEEGYLAGPLAPPPEPIKPLALPLPETARGQSWGMASLPLADLAEAGQWPIDFDGLTPLPPGLEPSTAVPGVRLFGGNRALAIAAWIAGLEPVRLEVSGRQLVLEAGLDDRWLLSDLGDGQAAQVAQDLQAARQDAGGLQFLAVQASPEDQRFSGFWMLRDLPDS